MQVFFCVDPDGPPLVVHICRCSCEVLYVDQCLCSFWQRCFSTRFTLCDRIQQQYIQRFILSLLFHHENMIVILTQTHDNVFCTWQSCFRCPRTMDSFHLCLSGVCISAVSPLQYFLCLPVPKTRIVFVLICYISLFADDVVTVYPTYIPITFSTHVFTQCSASFIAW